MLTKTAIHKYELLGFIRANKSIRKKQNKTKVKKMVGLVTKCNQIQYISYLSIEKKTTTYVHLEYLILQHNPD